MLRKKAILSIFVALLFSGLNNPALACDPDCPDCQEWDRTESECVAIDDGAAPAGECTDVCETGDCEDGSCEYEPINTPCGGDCGQCALLGLCQPADWANGCSEELPYCIYDMDPPPTPGLEYICKECRDEGAFGDWETSGTPLTLSTPDFLKNPLVAAIFNVGSIPDATLNISTTKQRSCCDEDTYEKLEDGVKCTYSSLSIEVPLASVGIWEFDIVDVEFKIGDWFGISVEVGVELGYEANAEITGMVGKIEYNPDCSDDTGFLFGELSGTLEGTVAAEASAKTCGNLLGRTWCWSNNVSFVRGSLSITCTGAKNGNSCETAEEDTGGGITCTPTGSLTLLGFGDENDPASGESVEEDVDYNPDGTSS